MVTQVTKQYREQIAVVLLAVAAVYVGCGLGLLFKGYDLARIGFSEKAALDGYLFSHPVLIACIVIAALLVGGWGEPSAHARTLVLAAVGIGAVALVFAVITWIAAFSSASGPFPAFVGIQGAGKVIGAFVVLAQIALLVLALFFAGIVLQALPRPVAAAAHWGAPYQQGWGAGPDWQQYGDWQGQQYPPHAGQPPAHAGPPAPWTQGQSAPWAQPPGWQPDQPSGWGAPPGYPSGPESAPTQAYEQPPSEATESPASNAELYWRSAAERETEPDDASTSGDTASSRSAAPDAGEEVAATSGEHRDPTAEVDQVDQADPDAADDEAHASTESADGTDTSGWWRPSSSS